MNRSHGELITFIITNLINDREKMKVSTVLGNNVNNHLKYFFGLLKFFLILLLYTSVFIIFFPQMMSDKIIDSQSETQEQ